MKKADIYHFSTNSHHPDSDGADHLGCISGTASGVATPRPSGTDKRLPGILHNYFGQVGASSLAAPDPSEVSNTFPIRSEMMCDDRPTKLAVGELPTAPASPVKDEGFSAPCPEREKMAFSGQYPTPPTSSPPPSRSRGSDDSGHETVKSRVTDIFKANRPKSGHLRSASSVPPLLARRHTQSAFSNPLSNVMTNNSVHAAHLSNPTNSPSATVPTSPTADLPSASALSSLTSHLEMIKLTDGITGSTVKATPPITPRTLSNDGSDTAKREASVGEHPVQRDDSVSTAVLEGSRAGPPVPPPKGKLKVQILGARGLRPSYDPYAVCVFEWIESIAHGQTQDESALDFDMRGRENSLGGLAIQRSGSDMGGRSMAIPMRSRQSSNTSLSDQKEFRHAREVTDLQWDHESVL